MLKKSLIGLASMVLLAGCQDKTFQNLDYLEFNDTILRHSYTNNYGVATGLLNVYTVYGNYTLAGPLTDVKVPAGIALTPQGFKTYSISKLLDKNPELKSDKALKAAEEQND